MSPYELIQLLATREYRELKSTVTELRDLPPALIFDTLFPIAVRQQGLSNGPVAMSAYVLHALNPLCPLTIETAVAALLPAWDISIEEVPWYLAKQFGPEAVLACVDQLAANTTDAVELVRLNTIRYWVGCVSGST
jgi:hypothetical protein